MLLLCVRHSLSLIQQIFIEPLVDGRHCTCYIVARGLMGATSKQLMGKLIEIQWE